jgi:hypothetical protein
MDSSFHHLRRRGFLLMFALNLGKSDRHDSRLPRLRQRTCLLPR